MRRALLLCAGLLATAAIIAPAASAAPATITGTGADLFDMSTYTHDAGTRATLVVTGGTHNATATGSGPDGKALFRSDTISSGSTAVNGTEYLALGVYPFICTVHPSTMQASLNVNAGAPKPRPAVALKVKSKSLDQAVDRGAVKVKVTITGGSGEEAEVDLKLGKKRIGTGATSATKTLKVRLSKKGRALLAGKSKAKVKAEGSIDFGSPAKATGTLK